MEKDERKRDDRPVKERGIESAKVGCEGKERDAIRLSAPCMRRSLHEKISRAAYPL